jgi:hypothetical protein
MLFICTGDLIRCNELHSTIFSFGAHRQPLLDVADAELMFAATVIYRS